MLTLFHKSYLPSLNSSHKSTSMAEQNENRQNDVAVGYPVDFLHFQQPHAAYGGPFCDDTPKNPFKHRCLLCFLCFFSLFLVTSSAIIAAWLRFSSDIHGPTIRVDAVTQSVRSAHDRSAGGEWTFTFFVANPDRFSILGFKKVKIAIVNGDTNPFDAVTMGYLMRDGNRGSYLDVKAEGLTITAERSGSSFRLELQATVLLGFGYVLRSEQWHALTATCGKVTVSSPASVLLAVGDFRGAKCIARVS